MCTVCGCGSDTVHIEGALQHSEPEQHTHAEPEQQSRRIQVEQDILAKNNHYAAHNRARFEAQQLLVLNLLSSPGSGKTTLLVETLKQLQSYCPLAVIEGDQQSSQDAERIRATGIPAIQINTGKGCHLDAHMVGHAAEQLADLHDGMLFIENVGNLVCPAAFDLGEGFKVAILSVTEGEDKPLKYPDIFYAADLMILNKIDLLPYLDFDIERCKSYARQINPDLTILELSATTGEGLESWLDWLEQQRVRV